MCGIAGVVGISDPKQQVRSMLGAMRHRGPDGQGLHSFKSGAVGMVRLALVDLSPRGQQPLWSSDGQVAIFFNGEMYNFREHRQRLKSAGYVFHSETDTEVVLALYLENPERFVDHLRGMYAFAVLDWRSRGSDAEPSILLGRDPMGIKPLYFAQPGGAGGALVFASELRAMLASTLIPRRVDRDALCDYLTFGFVLQPRSMLDGVQMLEPGTTLKVHPGEAAQLHKFWRMPIQSNAISSMPEAAAQLEAIFEESVRLHVLADAPVGAFLSGGVDSSAVVALMSRHNPKLRTYTLRVANSGHDESSEASAFARRLGCVHTNVEVDSAQVRDLFPRFAAEIDQPSTDGLNTWLLSRAAAKDVKGVLSGMGGDEWFAGYPVARRMLQLETGAGGFARQHLGVLAQGAHAHIQDGWIGNLTERGGKWASPLHLWAASHQVFKPSHLAALMGAETDDGAKLISPLSGPELPDADPLALCCRLDVEAYMRCQLLRDSDATSMANSLELRVPLVDLEIARFSRACHPSLKLSSHTDAIGKRVLRQSIHELLPTDIDRRPKRGFTLPYSEWAAGSLREIIEDTLSDETWNRRGLFAAPPRSLGELSPYPQQWALAVLELWCRAVLDPQ